MKINSDDRPTYGASMRRRSFLVAGSAAAGWSLFSLHKGLLPVQAGSSLQKDVSIVQFSDSGQRQALVTLPAIVKTDDQWKDQLSADTYAVARQQGTERAFSGKYWNLHDKGLYRCACCETALFNSDTKFESGTGWPSFWQPIAKENVREITDSSFGMTRTAVACTLCDGHLGHVFDDGPKPTRLRYCMNSVSLKFVKFA